jgi:hypothetical protein
MRERYRLRESAAAQAAARTPRGAGQPRGLSGGSAGRTGQLAGYRPGGRRATSCAVLGCAHYRLHRLHTLLRNLLPELGKRLQEAG